MVKKVTMWGFLEPLLYLKESIHLAEISRKLKSPHVTVRKHLNYFEKQGVVIKEIKGRLTNYKLNYSNNLLMDYLVLIEKNKLIRKCHSDLLMGEIVSFLHDNLGREILIFGSSVENLKNANDIDVLITGEKSKKNFKDFEKKFGVKFHIISPKKLEEVSDSLKEEIKKAHILIQNSEIIIKWMLKN